MTSLQQFNMLLIHIREDIYVINMHFNIYLKGANEAQAQKERGQEVQGHRHWQAAALAQRQTAFGRQKEWCVYHRLACIDYAAPSHERIPHPPPIVLVSCAGHHIASLSRQALVR